MPDCKIDGVEVFNVIPSHLDGSTVFLTVMFSILAAILLVAAIICLLKKERWNALLCATMCFAALSASWAISKYAVIPERAVVTISEEVNYIEFAESFKIIEQNGLLYTIEYVGD